MKEHRILTIITALVLILTLGAGCSNSSPEPILGTPSISGTDYSNPNNWLALPSDTYRILKQS